MWSRVTLTFLIHVLIVVLLNDTELNYGVEPFAKKIKDQSNKPECLQFFLTPKECTYYHSYRYYNYKCNNVV